MKERGGDPIKVALNCTASMFTVKSQTEDRVEGSWKSRECRKLSSPRRETGTTAPGAGEPGGPKVGFMHITFFLAHNVITFGGGEFHLKIRLSASSTSDLMTGNSLRLNFTGRESSGLGISCYN